MADNLPGIRLIGSYFQRSGIYVFVIAFACVYYLINAPLLLSHWDLGWHLAAGDLIRDQGHIPVQDPWSFTSGGRQWFNLSWLWDVFASVLFQYANFGGLILFVVACGAVIAGYLASVCLSSGASAIAVCISVLSACLFYPGFCGGVPEYLSRRFAEHFHHAVFRSLLRRMLEKNEAPLFAACNHGAVGQPAWRLFARSYYCWCFLRRGVAEARLGEFQNLWPCGSRLLYRDTYQSSWLAYL